MPSLSRDGDVFVLDVGTGDAGGPENRFHPDWMAEITTLLDEVDAAPSPRALVTTATGKFFSNGLDLDWLGQNTDRVEEYVVQVHELLARTLELAVPTVAALQGHTYAGGAMFALAHDWRVMRADRGFLCLPEADINIPFTPGMNALLLAKMTPAAATDTMVGARRLGGEDALAAGIVDAVASEDELLGAAVARAGAQAAKLGPTLATIKARMYGPVIALLRDREANRLGA
jgi:enoyl-CoA hydratase/carnithine racemase